MTVRGAGFLASTRFVMADLVYCYAPLSGDAYLKTMEDLDEVAETLTEDEQTRLQFALGKAYADVGEHERSFRHLLEAMRRNVGGSLTTKAPCSVCSTGSALRVENAIAPLLPMAKQVSIKLPRDSELARGLLRDVSGTKMLRSLRC
jgi:hypothetical protein